MKKLFATLSILIFFGNMFGQQQSLVSPDGKIVVRVVTADSLELSISYSDQTLVKKINPTMIFGNHKIFGFDNSFKKAQKKEVNKQIEATIPTKSAVIQDHYNELTLVF